MKDLKGTKTEKNIEAAFQGESLARNRYTFFEEQARMEGNEDVAQMFARMSKNEMTHAKFWFKMMNGGLGDSLTNIQQSANGENYEWCSMYPEFAKVAREEGFHDVADMFERVAGIERDHELTFLKAFAAMKSSVRQEAEIHSEPSKAVYRCMFCGAVFERRPDVCSVCGAIGSFESGVV